MIPLAQAARRNIRNDRPMFQEECKINEVIHLRMETSHGNMMHAEFMNDENIVPNDTDSEDSESFHNSR